MYSIMKREQLEFNDWFYSDGFPGTEGSFTECYFFDTTPDGQQVIKRAQIDSKKALEETQKFIEFDFKAKKGKEEWDEFTKDALENAEVIHLQPTRQEDGFTKYFLWSGTRTCPNCATPAYGDIGIEMKHK